MPCARRLAAAIALVIAACSPPPSDDPPRVALHASGPAWRAKGFSRDTEGCTQTWACDCSGVAARAGCHTKHSGDATTQGACAADTGHLSGCTRCMALEPADPCTCTAACP